MITTQKNSFLKFIFKLLLCFLVIGCNSNQIKKKLSVNEAKLKDTSHSKIDAIINVAETQYKGMLTTLKEEEFPKSTFDDGSLKKEKVEGWTSGFFPGSLWMLHQYTGKEFWKSEAEKKTAYLEPAQYYDFDHDMGFRVYCSYGKGYKITNKEEYKDILIQAAKTLTKRFNEKVGLIKSWDRTTSWDGVTEWDYPVIIDNMMNLELLFYAYHQTQDEFFKNIAITHAENTIKNFYREDFSTYHVVDFDPKTGEVKDKATFQGYADNSAWARGQSWGLYGFTVMYRETKNSKYLKQAENIAGYLMNHKKLPKDKIPFWDYYAEEEGYTPEYDYNPANFKDKPKDASSAAIMASALYELSGFVNSSKQNKYKKYADQLILSLSSPKYLAESGKNNHFILKHNVGSLPHGAEIDKPLVYADYYFLEALIRKRNLEKTDKLVSKL